MYIGCTNVVSMAESGPLAVIEEMPNSKQGKYMYSWNCLSNDESKNPNEPNGNDDEVSDLSSVESEERMKAFQSCSSGASAVCVYTKPMK